MQLIAQTLFKTTRNIVDADVTLQMTAVLQKGKGENIVTINDEDVFKVSSHVYMVRIVENELVMYDGQDIYFYTLDGECTQQVTVGRHVFDLLPMKYAVAITYRDEGVYDDPIGKETIVVVKNDGTKISQLAFAEVHRLHYDIRFAKVKPFACISPEINKIVHFNQHFDLLKIDNCPFDLGNVIALSYQYPYLLFAEENRWICLHEDGKFEIHEQEFSVNLRSNYHRGPSLFIEIFEQQQLISYSLQES